MRSAPHFIENIAMFKCGSPQRPILRGPRGEVQMLFRDWRHLSPLDLLLGISPLAGGSAKGSDLLSPFLQQTVVVPRGAASIDACIKIDCSFQTLMAKQLFDQL